MSDELKPCGSCGSVEAEIGIIGGATFWVECSACGACSSSHDDEYDAIAAWNSRPIEDALRDRIDALEWLREVESIGVLYMHNPLRQRLRYAVEKRTCRPDDWVHDLMEGLEREHKATLEAAREAVEV